MSNFVSIKYRLFLTVLLIVSFILGFYLFCRGFLLTRQVLLDKSNCNDVQHPDVSGCWLPAEYDRIVILVIDALRYDFVAPQDERKSGFNAIYHNRLKSIQSALRDEPDQSLLASFVADPPTTTLQRLKGLTTGSLPTFIDAGSNFAGAAIDEDNWVQQVNTNKGNVTLLGDDTWLALFPDSFARKHAFPSFDVKDLHTVDNGIMDHLRSELSSVDSYSVLIAHFLGVDHCGHKYGPNHNQMIKKLDQMDAIISNVMSELSAGSLLLVLGDHGMTQTGDHGGDSPNELNSALFAYSKHKHIHQRGSSNVIPSVSQIDLVPTICLLLDVPVPFSNLGVLIQPLFPAHNLHRALTANLMQVMRYAEAYSVQQGSTAPLSIQLHPVLRIYNSLLPSELSNTRCAHTMQRIQHIFRETWAKFHEAWMMLGLVAITESLLWTLHIVVEPQAQDARRILLKCTAIALEVFAIFGETEGVPPLLGMVLLIEIGYECTQLFNLLLHHYEQWHTQTLHVIVYSLPVLLALGMASNSIVIHLDTVTRFLCVTCVLLCVYRVCQNTAALHRSDLLGLFLRPIGHRARAIKNVTQFVRAYLPLCMLLCCVICCASFRLASIYWRCREEQLLCEQWWPTVPFASLPDHSLYRPLRLILALISLWSAVLVPYQYLKRNGHIMMDDNSVNGRSIWQCYMPAVCAMCISVYWVGQALPETTVIRYSTALQYAPVLCVYVCTVLHTVYSMYDPLLIHLVWRSDEPNRLPQIPLEQTLHKETLLKRLTQHLNEHKTHRDTLKPYAYGLATMYNGCVLALYSEWLFVLMVVLGDGLAPAVLQIMFVLGVLCYIAMHITHNQTHAHQPNFPSIPWAAAFVGLPGNFSAQWAQAALVILHIFSGQIIFGLSLPIVLLAAHLQRLRQKNPENETTITQFDLFCDNERTEQIVWTGCMQSVVLAGFKAVACSIVSQQHRRHLMLWKIFAPNFLFQVVSFAVQSICALIGWLLVCRIHTAARTLMRT